MGTDLYYENHRGLTEQGVPVITREYEILRQGEEVRVHWHEGVELIYVLSGSCKLTRNRKTVTLREGEIALISAGQLHRVFVDEEDVRYEYLILERELWDELRLPPDTDQFTEEVIRDERLGWLVEEMTRVRDIEGNFGFLQKKGLLFLILGRILEDFSSKKKESGREDRRLVYVRKAIAYMEQNYKKSVNADILEQVAGYSKYHFCHCFKELTGMTPVEYLNRLRCERVQTILAAKGGSIQNVALSCGFFNMSYFYDVRVKSICP